MRRENGAMVVRLFGACAKQGPFAIEMEIRKFLFFVCLGMYFYTVAQRHFCQQAGFITV